MNSTTAAHTAEAMISCRPVRMVSGRNGSPYNPSKKLLVSFSDDASLSVLSSLTYRRSVLVVVRLRRTDGPRRACDARSHLGFATDGCGYPRISQAPSSAFAIRCALCQPWKSGCDAKLRRLRGSLMRRRAVRSAEHRPPGFLDPCQRAVWLAVLSSSKKE